MKYLLAFLFILATAASGAFLVHEKNLLSVPRETVGAALPQTAAVFETSLQSPITSSASSLTLTANAIRGGGTISGYSCFTIDEGSAQAEFVCGTVSGTSVTALSRGISPATGTTTVAALQFAHRRGANVKITDFPIVQILRAQANGQDTYPNPLSYTFNFPASFWTTAASSTLVTLGQLNDTAVSGAPNANETTKGIVELGTALETASSTSLGSTAASLVLQSKNATDTPQSGCATGYTSTAGAGCAIIAQLSGKLRQTWLDFTALWTFTGGLTSTGTTTISASNINTNPLVLNTLPFSFLSTRQASSTVLTEDGTGKLRFILPQVYMIGGQNVNGSISGTTGSTTEATLVIPANTIQLGSGDISIKANWSGLSSSNNCFYEIGWGNGSATSSILNYGRGSGDYIFSTQTDLSATSTPNGGFAMTLVNPPQSVNAPFTTVGAPATSGGYVRQDVSAISYISFIVRSASATCGLSNFSAQVSRL